MQGGEEYASFKPMSSRFAVLLLLFFIAGTIIIEPLLARSIAAGRGNGSPYASQFIGKPYIISPNAFLTAARRPVVLGNIGQAPRLDALAKTVRLRVTAYSSSPDETDESPWITATGTHTGYGVVATNLLPLGTRIRLPRIFGNQVFIVEDRMNARYSDRLDVWLPSKTEAIRFGEKLTDVEVL